MPNSKTKTSCKPFAPLYLYYIHVSRLSRSTPSQEFLFSLHLKRLESQQHAWWNFEMMLITVLIWGKICVETKTWSLGVAAAFCWVSFGVQVTVQVVHLSFSNPDSSHATCLQSSVGVSPALRWGLHPHALGFCERASCRVTPTQPRCAVSSRWWWVWHQWCWYPEFLQLLVDWCWWRSTQGHRAFRVGGEVLPWWFHSSGLQALQRTLEGTSSWQHRQEGHRRGCGKAEGTDVQSYVRDQGRCGLWRWWDPKGGGWWQGLGLVGCWDEPWWFGSGALQVGALWQTCHLGGQAEQRWWAVPEGELGHRLGKHWEDLRRTSDQAAMSRCKWGSVCGPVQRSFCDIFLSWL